MTKKDIRDIQKQIENQQRIALYWRIWRDREDADGNHYSQVSGRRMPAKFSTLFFHHILPKSKYPKAEFDKENIIIILPEEHENVENSMYLYKIINEKRVKLEEKYGIK